MIDEEGGCVMRFGSVCSGMGAAEHAWQGLDWECSFMSEIEQSPRAVLQHHYPDTPLHGDFTTIEAGQYDPIDALVGGTPCQSFSIAGLRKGLSDDRGNLALEFLRLAHRLKPKWVVWENVPGVLSSNGGRDFGAFLGAMVELGYGFAYRVLDAQYTRVDGFEHAVPQRRRRVFVIGRLGDWRRAAAVLFDREGMSWNPPPRRETGQGVAPLTANGVGASGADVRGDQAGHLIASTGDVSHCLNAGGMGRIDYETETLVAHSLTAGMGKSASRLPHEQGALIPEAAETWDVRRLMPVECERLQGFPDDYTLVPYRGRMMADGPRYRMIGNSMAVNVMTHIGRRIQAVEDLGILPSQRDLSLRDNVL